MATEPVSLLLGAGELDRLVSNAEKFLVSYRGDDGYRYLNYQPITPKNRLVPEDLAVTILMNSRVKASAFKSVQDHGASLNLDKLPNKALEQTTDHERQELAGFIAEIAKWSGFATSVATKVLHKKRPYLIPVLDNQAIFGAYMNPHWPKQRSRTDSIYSIQRILPALNWITTDITRDVNSQGWRLLKVIEPERSMIELFDMVWWMYFRDQKPISRASFS